MAGASPVGGTSVPGNAGKSDLDQIGSGIVERQIGQAHEGGNSSKSRKHRASDRTKKFQVFHFEFSISKLNAICCRTLEQSYALPWRIKIEESHSQLRKINNYCIVPAMSSLVDLKRLKLFRQVVECGGLSAAEAVLNINLPTISAHLAALETSLGMRLCDRGRGGFRLTAHGTSVLAACDRLFESVENFRAEIGEVSDLVSGNLRIGLADNTITDPGCPVIAALRQLRASSRDLEISVDIRNPVELERALREERIDVAVGPFQLTDPGIEQYPLYKERLSLYVGEGHPLFTRKSIGLRDLDGADYVMRGYLRESQVVQHVSFNDAATAQSMEGLANLILTGHYVGYLPEHYAANWVRARRIRRILPEQMSYDVQFKLITMLSRRHTRATNAFIDIVRSLIAP
ncbi:MAG: LysR family transcriptional regulator [Ideonella sp.]